MTARSSLVHRSLVRRSIFRTWSIVGIGLFVALVGACGPSTPPPQQPDNSAGGTAPTGDTGAEGKVARAEKLIADKQWDQAKTVLNEEIGSNPKNAKAVFYLGVCDENTGDVEGAKASYKKALDIDPKLVDAALNLAAILLDSKDPAGALPYIQQGLAADPKHPLLLQNRALALDDLGKSDEAAKAYAAALEVQPDNGQLRAAYASLLVKLDKKDAALPQLKLLVDKTDDPVMLAAVSNWYGKLSAFKECVGALDKALKMKQESEFYSRRGLCKHGLNDEDGARKDYEQAVAADPKSAAAHYYLGRALAEKDAKKALEELNKAVELDTSNTKAISKAAKEEIDKLKSKKKK